MDRRSRQYRISYLGGWMDILVMKTYIKKRGRAWVRI